MVILILVFTVSIVLLGRTVLIVVGGLKGPVLQVFEAYGNQEPYYSPYTGFFLWMGVVLFSGGMLLDRVSSFGAPFQVIGVVFGAIALLLWARPEDAKGFLSYIPILPTWYARLNTETTRRERRRIAYMWLRLPLRTRLLYSASDRMFFLWVDLVVVSTVREV